MKHKPVKNIAIYQAKSGAIEFRGDFGKDTILGTQKQIAEVFDVDRSVVSKHIKNIFRDKELDPKVVSAKFAHTTAHGAVKGKTQTKMVEYYNLDIILAVGYRTNSARAIAFRQWATKVLREHLLQGYTINKKRIGQNYEKFMRAVANVKALLPAGNKIKTEEVLELISAFAATWFSLDAYDKSCLPKKGTSKKSIQVQTSELAEALSEFKEKLIAKKQATKFFAQERKRGHLEGIVGNVFQSAFGKDVYSTLEEKAAHLLYFMVKNHPFIDGNKRSGAFVFVWFLRKAGLLRISLTPEALTAITLLVAESNPKEKEKMVGLILLFINGRYE